MYNLEKLSYRKIAKILNRGKTSITEEINKDTLNKKRKYNAARAYNSYLDRQKNKGNISKIENNIKLKIFIINKLKEGWSPEQISYRLKGRFNQGIGNVCTETIYQYIYKAENKHLKFFKFLRRRQKKRRKWYSREQYKKSLKIPERTSISKRPKIINKRIRFGDWETDSMIFSKQKEIISVQIERKTRLVRLHKCPNKTAEETYEALVKTMEDFINKLIDKNHLFI
jgi:IS30 family transposase